MSSKQLKVSYSKQFARDLTDLAKRYPNVLVGTKIYYSNALLVKPLAIAWKLSRSRISWELERLSRLAHIQGDLVLIYQHVTHDEFDELKFARLNTHSQTALK